MCPMAKASRDITTSAPPGGPPAEAEERARIAEERRLQREEDLRLIEATLAGDMAAFETLFTRCRDKVYAVVYGYVHDKDDALDITQDAFVKSYRKLDTFGGRSSFFTWVTQIAINLAIDHTRKRKRRRVIQLEEHMSAERRLAAASEPPKPGAELLDAELKARYEAALAELSDKHRTVFVLHTVEGLAYKEIAEVLGISIGTVMSRLHYARKRLQGLLSGYLDRR